MLCCTMYRQLGVKLSVSPSSQSHTAHGQWLTLYVTWHNSVTATQHSDEPRKTVLCPSLLAVHYHQAGSDLRKPRCIAVFSLAQGLSVLTMSVFALFFCSFSFAFNPIHQ